MSYILILIGVTFIIAGGLSLKKHTNPSKTVTTGSMIENALSQEQASSQKKGLDFEVFVMDHFNNKYFKLLNWRGDKINKGRYPESNRYPDMEYELLTNKREQFAVECKWRKSFQNGVINWATEEQIEIYNKFAENRKMNVIIVIGLGGEPSNPESIYAIPLRSLKYSIAKQSYLEQFKREDVQRKFFYNSKMGTLE